MVFGRVRERARERREEPRESEREQGGGVASSGASSEEGRAGRQPSRWRGAVARARAATLHSLCRGRRRQRREAGWAACWLGRPAAAGLHREEPQVSFSFFLFFFLCFVLFNLFCHCFEFKIIQTMPKTPLNIFIWLDGLFQKLIKYFRGI